MSPGTRSSFRNQLDCVMKEAVGDYNLNDQTNQDKVMPAHVSPSKWAQSYQNAAKTFLPLNETEVIGALLNWPSAEIAWKISTALYLSWQRAIKKSFHGIKLLAFHSEAMTAKLEWEPTLQTPNRPEPQVACMPKDSRLLHLNCPCG
jgi:hypothetical protein